ncbi:elongation factor 4 [Candidatus Uhrbacteria bacterium RIFCSPLOWO2_12_FULL_47_10]|nr:MAG: elongation factor 4 [Candidatus Uhrbacteria bacterium RIFCSPLOWO2_12_FULL_47_10]
MVGDMEQSKIRNFCIIAHIDHGKSTLADRFLELTGTVEKRQMKEQLLDQMDIERERGITIKLAPVRMNYVLHTTPYVLNLIDTPGHVDFTYEVSRSLAAVEGAILLVDATQGVQAQTICNLYLALEQNLTIIPVVNKIDLPSADVAKTKAELMHLIGCKEEEILAVSGRTGEGVPELLEAIVERVPAPHPNPLPQGERELQKYPTPLMGGDKGGGVSLRALIFDSIYDTYRGVVAYVRVFDGEIKKGEKIIFMATKAQSEALEVGFFKPKFVPSDSLGAGEIGYIVTGLKDIAGCRVGDTITGYTLHATSYTVEPLPGYKEVKPMVFAGIFPKVGDEYSQLREAMGKLKLNDGALSYEPEKSTALGFGFRCGFLGLLHLEIVEERLRREHNVEVITTVPSVAYRVSKTDGQVMIIKGAQELPDQNYIQKIEEPWVKIDVVVPKKYIGGVMQLVQEKRGVYVNTEYMLPSPQPSPIRGEGENQVPSPSMGEGDSAMDESGEGRVILHYELPLASILVDFYDKLKSVSSGYASLNYELTKYKEADVVRLDILVAEDQVEALATVVYSDSAQDSGRKIVEALKKTLPRQQFEIKIQAALGGKIIASERISPLRKDVTAKLYGGDVTRKMKLLEKQKKGKKKMAAMGHGAVDIPPAAYLAVLKR